MHLSLLFSCRLFGKATKITMNPNFGFHLTSGLPPPPQPPTIQPHSMANQQIPPAPAVSPTGRQSVPGRRTPVRNNLNTNNHIFFSFRFFFFQLGSVGIGGFYAQSALSPSHIQHQTDENLPSGSRERYLIVAFSDVASVVSFLCYNFCFSKVPHKPPSTGHWSRKDKKSTRQDRTIEYKCAWT